MSTWFPPQIYQWKLPFKFSYPKFQIRHWDQNSYAKVNHSQNTLLEHVQQFPAGYRHPRIKAHLMELSKHEKLNSWKNKNSGFASIDFQGFSIFFLVRSQHSCKRIPFETRWIRRSEFHHPVRGFSFGGILGLWFTFLYAFVCYFISGCGPAVSTILSLNFLI